MPIKIPTAYEPALSALLQMPCEQRRNFVDAVRVAPTCREPSELVAELEAATDLGGKTLLRIVRMLVSLYDAKQQGPFNEFASEVCEAAQISGTEALRPYEGDWKSFEEDLTNLLAADSAFGMMAKVQEVRRQYPHLYCTARVLSDIRPVFGPEASEKPLVGAVVHTLRITYHEGKGVEELYVALDASDLRSLRAVINRALQKDRTLGDLISESGMSCLGVESE